MDGSDDKEARRRVRSLRGGMSSSRNDFLVEKTPSIIFFVGDWCMLEYGWWERRDIYKGGFQCGKDGEKSGDDSLLGVGQVVYVAEGGHAELYMWHLDGGPLTCKYSFSFFT